MKPESRLHLASLILRVTSALMLTHGWKKLSTFGDKMHTFADPLHIGSTASLALTVFAEFFCTLFIVTGLFTRIAVIPLIITFLVIVLIVHAPDPFGEKEPALLYLLIYTCILITGSGKYSLDHLLRKKY
ncbi:MAG TPA: DoxX family protein [Bacteroidia bacterium]|nr:DoxX family protein [Bacteroidia bacterium]